MVKKYMARICLVLIILDIFCSCVMDRKATFYIKNCTSDTLLINFSGADTLVNWNFWGEQAIDSALLNRIGGIDIAFNWAISNCLTPPNSILYVAPYIYNKYDVCYVYVIKWNVAKRYSIDEIRVKRMYDRRTVTKKDFKNRLYEYYR